MLHLRSFLGLGLIPTLNCAVAAFAEKLQMQHQMALLLTAPVQQHLGRMSHQTWRQGQAAATTDKCLLSLVFFQP
jgi:hypothetical protein